jgi:hypothetical protein
MRWLRAANPHGAGGACGLGYHAPPMSVLTRDAILAEMNAGCPGIKRRS